MSLLLSKVCHFLNFRFLSSSTDAKCLMNPNGVSSCFFFSFFVKTLMVSIGCIIFKPEYILVALLFFSSSKS